MWRRWNSRRVSTSGIDAGDAGSSALSRNEYIDILAKRVLYSRAYTIFYVSLICSGVAEVAWILLPTAGGVGILPQHGLFTVVESYVTAGLVLELALHATLQRRSFWLTLGNYLDAAVATVSVVSTISLVVGVETRSEALFADILVITRVVFRLLRLLTITKRFKRQQLAADRKLEVEVRAHAAGTLLLPYHRCCPVTSSSATSFRQLCCRTMGPGATHRCASTRARRRQPIMNRRRSRKKTSPFRHQPREGEMGRCACTYLLVTFSR